jgi:carboxyl-terminal processing protease
MIRRRTFQRTFQHSQYHRGAANLDHNGAHVNHRLLAISFALTTATSAWLHGAWVHASHVQPEPQEAQVTPLVAEVLSRYHYKKLPVDEMLADKILDQYLKTLDPERLFFVQADIDRMMAERAKLADAILSGDMTLPFAMFDRYELRVKERMAFARARLKEPFDFRRDESYPASRSKEPWVGTEAEMRELWRKRVKNDWLRLKLAGKDDKNIAAVLDKRYETIVKRIEQLKSTDVFQTFMNAYTTAVEPHTNYLSSRAAANFDISMRLSLVGIGASLVLIDEYTTIRELIPGGPAALSGQLQVGDRIVGVAQGETGTMADVMGWRLDDTVALIRGTADSVVVLDVLPADAGPDGKHKRISLVRKTITLADQAAKGTVHSVADNGATRRIGVIALPSFYEDVSGRQRGAKDYRSATRDVAKLLGDFSKQKLDGVLIDLRNNGGGSLAEAIELTGLFIDKGPVVQQRNARGQITVGSDTEAGVAWDGPVAVLINRNSASASEIFAAAIQDYGRGFVFGERSFGKGTVQTIVDLDKVNPDARTKRGQLKMTIAQFFRINGGSTQLRGVTPDIAFPSLADAEPFGESSLDNAIPWSQVKPAEYPPAGDLRPLVKVLAQLHEARVKQDRTFQDLEEDIAMIKQLRSKNAISLNEATRRAERDADEARRKSREARSAARKSTLEATGKSTVAEVADSDTTDDGLQANERTLASQLAAEKSRKNAKDILLDESVRILSDAVGVAKADASFAARIRPPQMAVPVN